MEEISLLKFSIKIEEKEKELTGLQEERKKNTRSTDERGYDSAN